MSSSDAEIKRRQPSRLALCSCIRRCPQVVDRGDRNADSAHVRQRAYRSRCHVHRASAGAIRARAGARGHRRRHDRRHDTRPCASARHRRAGNRARVRHVGAVRLCGARQAGGTRAAPVGASRDGQRTIRRVQTAACICRDRRRCLRECGAGEGRARSRQRARRPGAAGRAEARRGRGAVVQKRDVGRGPAGAIAGVYSSVAAIAIH